MIFMCSRGRRELLQKFMDVSQPRLEGRVLIDDDDNSYDGMKLPHGWDFVVGKRGSVTEILNRAFKKFPDEPYYAVICDDMLYTDPVPGWDALLSAAAAPRYVSWGDDGRFSERLCTSFWVGGDLVRAFGWLQHPDIGHLYADTVWWTIARGAKIARYLPEVSYRHHKVMDRTFAERSIQGDATTFERLRMTEIPFLTRKAHDLGHTVNQS